MKIINKLWRLKEGAVKTFSLEYREFLKVFPAIDSIEGFLKSPHQEFWFFKTAWYSTKDAIIVEIGSFKGRSTVSFGFACRNTDRHVYAIDLFEGDNNIYGSGDFISDFNRNVSSCGLEPYITPIKKHSLEVAKSWIKPIDILFIDGSHEYEDVKDDFNAFYPFVKPGGIIALHDIRGMWDGVVRFWNEVKQQNLLCDIGEVGSLGYGRKPL
ncbi:MAG: class I SAM-dependent methyltransferase [Cyclobacteriaceae bacterium]|nr:class I SAM-dependent methyltransferase [Cyclobacteriaceae bacterium]